MSVLMKRRSNLETVTLERYTGRDGQGAPSYGSSLSFEARVEERDTASSSRASGTQYVIGPDGTEVFTPLTLYVPGGEANIPAQRDRVTLSGGATYIAMEVSKIRGLRAARSAPDYVRVRCADE